MNATVQAKILRNKVWSHGGKIRLPIDPFQIAKELNIKVLFESLEKNVSGFILKEANEDPVITVNKNDHIHRQRFTVAHEIGHFIRRQGDDVIGYVDFRDEISSLGTDFEEQWSNSFAAELLMPEAGVSQRWADGESISSLATRYEVSKTAMEHRVENLGLI